MSRSSTSRVILSFGLGMALLTLTAASFEPGRPDDRRQRLPQGQIVFTANAFDTNADGIVDAADNDIMFSVAIGADPEDGRLQIAGNERASAAFPRLTRDGEIVVCHAFVDTNGDEVVDPQTDMPFLWVLNADGTEVTRISEPGSVVAMQAAWSPDERRIVFAYADSDSNGDGLVNTADTLHLAIQELGALDPANPSAAQLARDFAPTILTDATLSVSRPQFWTDAAILFEAVRVSDGQRGIYVFDLDTAAVSLLSPDGVQARNPVPSPDGDRIAAEVETAEGPSFWVYSTGTGQWEDVADHLVAPSAPTWSPDGTLLAMAENAEGAGRVVIFDGETTETLVRSDSQISMTAFSPGGDSIAFAATPQEGGNTRLNVITLDGEFAATLTPPGTDLTGFVWNPDSDAPVALRTQ